VRELRRHERCLNCDEPVATRFCGGCGQENTDYRVSLRRLTGDLFEELFQLESRLWRTLGTLVRRPGLITCEYNAGRRVRYTTPLRLYLLASVAYFALASVMPARPVTVGELNFSEHERQELRSMPASPLGKRLRERVLTLSQSDPRAVARRVGAAFDSQVPKAMALLLPAFALLTWLFFRRRRLFFVEHLVLALHVHAFAFSMMFVAKLTQRDAVLTLAFVGSAVWTVLALRRVFATSWLATLWRAALIGVVYSVLVGAVLAAITIASLWFD
jgi:hypothetical protein